MAVLLCLPQDEEALCPSSSTTRANEGKKVWSSALSAAFICERVASGDIEILRVESTNNLADLFTKILPRDAHLSLVRALSLTE